MLRVGLIGCGNIADQHVQKIQAISDCELVGVCDKEELMAKQLSDRYKVNRYFTDVTSLLEQTAPNVVHITTPGTSHLVLGRLCLEAGCHIFVEKPFALTAGDAELLIKLANEKRLKVTVGHNLQFSHASMRMRKLISDGYLGGPPVHLESYYGYDLGDAKYARAILGDRSHWIRSLPGRLLHNLISHGIGKIAPFIASDNPRVIALGFKSAILDSIQENDIIDELRVIIHDEDYMTAYFTFSTQIRPVLRHFRIYGPKNALIVDDDHQIVLKLQGRKYKSCLNQFVPPYKFAVQHLANLRHNLLKFVRNDLHSDSGMTYLINAFYRSIVEDTPIPISHREIIVTARIMDLIFQQIYEEPVHRSEIID